MYWISNGNLNMQEENDTEQGADQNPAQAGCKMRVVDWIRGCVHDGLGHDGSTPNVQTSEADHTECMRASSGMALEGGNPGSREPRA
jgi:hypothetical protein